MFIMDRYQAYLDALDREEKYVRHSLFCEWWKKRSLAPGGMEARKCRDESNRRITEAGTNSSRSRAARRHLARRRCASRTSPRRRDRASSAGKIPPSCWADSGTPGRPSSQSKQDVGRDLNMLPFCGRGPEGRPAVAEEPDCALRNRPLHAARDEALLQEHRVDGQTQRGQPGQSRHHAPAGAVHLAGWHAGAQLGGAGVECARRSRR